MQRQTKFCMKRLLAGGKCNSPPKSCNTRKTHTLVHFKCPGKHICAYLEESPTMLTGTYFQVIVYARGQTVVLILPGCQFTSP